MNHDLTDKHRRIIRRVARGEEWRAAAKAEGCSDSYARVLRARLLKNPAAVRELDAIQAEGRKLAVYDLAKAMEEAAEVIAFAKQHKHPTAYFFAVRHRAHLSGLLVDKIQLDPGVDLRGSLDRAAARVNITNITLLAPLPPVAPLPLPSKAAIRFRPHIPGDQVDEEPKAGPNDGKSNN